MLSSRRSPAFGRRIFGPSSAYRLFVALGLASLAGCGDSATAPDRPVAEITVGPTGQVLLVGETVTLTAVARDADGKALTGRPITWTTSDTTIATVSGGVVSALAGGPVTITATSEGVSATADVSIIRCRTPEPLPVGTLAYNELECRHEFTTSDGWKIWISRYVVTVIEPAIHDALQLWGGTTDPAAFAALHENLNGKHIKDRFGKNRSILLPSGALMTIVTEGEGGPAITLSIYEGGQSHTFDTRATKLVHTSAGDAATAAAREQAEADGETATLTILPNGSTVFTNVYTQEESSTGQPLEKVWESVPLGTTGGYANPRQINDLFDDPRLDHT